MTTPKYLEAFRQAARKTQTCEKSEVSEKRGGGEGLNSLNTLISPFPLGRFGRFGRTFSALEARCPDHVPPLRWQQAVEDGRRFLATWGSQAEAMGWTSADLFGLAPIPDTPAASYQRLSRYDCTGLCWLLEGRPVVALTADTATIRNPSTGTTALFRKNHRPALGPLGDSLEDFKCTAGSDGTTQGG
jgi:hypothetical protein